ncbi:amiloride-sensitive sodium channel subunit beta-2-like [Belonocnema kinseyi]|uniref:amiloride-sensitive sodium channel subunit beta-2-like n=1 Tax=Belonocnema kinseyi TaxID=2817044 RepID=UPI00143DD92E|nr:amiloride-sensitive sodium channel subunit beta-2-like [Belonocnema kinseyi]
MGGGDPIKEGENVSGVSNAENKRVSDPGSSEATVTRGVNYSPQCEKFNYHYAHEKNIHCKSESDCPGSNEVLKTPGPGIDVGLTVELNIEPEFYFASIRDYPAAFIIIHGSKDFPETDILTFTAQANYKVKAVIFGTVIEALDEMKTLTKVQRKCIFPDEIPHDYSYQSCLSGCKLKRIMTACINISDQITNLFKRQTLDNGKILEKCYCQPLCNATNYSFLSLDKNDLFYLENPTLFAKFNLSIVNVFFRDFGYTKYEMSLFLSWNDLIARLGGIIGLCLGGSIISLMEPIIYIILTPFRRVHHREIRPPRADLDNSFERVEVLIRGVYANETVTIL